MELVEVGLVLLVDDGGSGFEAVPEVFAQFTRYGSYLCPLVVQLLECTACLHYGGVLLQFLCCLAEQGLHLEVLLEVQVAQLDVYLDEVVELLLVLLVEFPNLLRVGGGNLSDGLPLGLEVAHLLEVAHHVGGLRLCHGFHLLEDSLLALQVLLHLRFVLGSHFGFLLLVFVEQFAELEFHGVGLGCPRRLVGCVFRTFIRLCSRLGSRLACCLQLLVILTVELGLQLLYLFFHCHHIILRYQRLQLFHELLITVCHIAIIRKFAAKIAFFFDTTK